MTGPTWWVARIAYMVATAASSPEMTLIMIAAAEAPEHEQQFRRTAGRRPR